MPRILSPMLVVTLAISNSAQMTQFDHEGGNKGTVSGLFLDRG